MLRKFSGSLLTNTTHAPLFFTARGRERKSFHDNAQHEHSQSFEANRHDIEATAATKRCAQKE